MIDIATLVRECHQRSKQAGWWNDLLTGQPLIVVNKSIVPEKLCLIHSEISEAFEGVLYDLMDDKLPHRTMVEVELADVVIRLADLCGALGVDLQGAVNDVRIENNLVDGICRTICLAHSDTSKAMEGFRKNLKDKKYDRSQLEVSLARLYIRVIRWAEHMHLDLEGAISEKMDFNAVRPDHQIENRKKPGGKSF